MPCLRQKTNSAAVARIGTVTVFSRSVNISMSGLNPSTARRPGVGVVLAEVVDCRHPPGELPDVGHSRPGVAGNVDDDVTGDPQAQAQALKETLLADVLSDVCENTPLAADGATE